MSSQRMRKNIAFSSKNADIFEILSAMQADNKNISDYLCDLVRKDLEPQKTEILNDDIISFKEQLESTNDGVNFLKSKLMEIETILKDIKDSKIVIAESNSTESEINEEPQFLDSNMQLPTDLGEIDGLFF